MKTLLFSIFYLYHLFSNYSIVFIHIGNNIPIHTKTAIEQARLFNPDARIILLSNKPSLNSFLSFKESLDIELINYETLEMTAQHKLYQRRCVQRDPFWKFTSERFLYLYDLINAYSLENVFHLENDNMLYANLDPLLPIFQKYYPSIGATFDNDNRCIAGFIWIVNKKSILPLAKYFANLAHLGLNDMELIGRFKNAFGVDKIDNLPIIMKEYTEENPMISPHNHKTNQISSYYKNSEKFQSIFDAAAIGQYLGGIDPIHANNEKGFINESCLFNPSLLTYCWEKDENNRLIPYATYNLKKYKILNLHIHSKRLNEFKS